MSKKRDAELDSLSEQILTDAYGDEEQLWAFRQAFEVNISVPCGATVVGEPVQVTKFDYDGNARRGLTATCRRPDGSRHTVAASDVVLDDAARQTYIAAYRQWMGIAPYPPTIKLPKAKQAPVADAAKHNSALVLERDVELAVLSVSQRAARCRILDTDEVVTLRAGRLWDVVPGEVAVVKPAKRWTYGGNPYLSGTIESKRLDVKALGLTPLRLESCGIWDPAEEYWGEPGERIEPWAKPIIKRGPRPQFEMEQVIPGEDPEDPLNDPILEANDRKDSGDYSGAHDILMQLCRADLRCLDAHSHLGNIPFDTRPKDAIRHYEVGLRIGELSLPSGFDGVLPWGFINNRPFLRCMHGFGLCLWRLNRFEECAVVFDRMLWLNPSDNQGVRFMIDQVRARRPWKEDR